MARRDRTQFPPLPEPLPRHGVDNHTHLDSIIPFWRRAENGLSSSSEKLPEAPIQPSENAYLDEMLRQAHAAGITRIVQCGCELPTALWTDEFLRRLDAEPDVGNRARVVGAIAIHPNEAVLHAGVSEIATDGLEPRFLPHHRVPLADAIAEIARLAAANPAIRAIGETGLDFFRAGPLGAQVQAESFRAHIALAKELELALQIHDRDAHQAVVEILLAEGAPERTVFHCFSGDRELAEYCVSQGWYLSFAGPVTYPANADLREAVVATPVELLLAETDAPYLTPHPYRGRPNAPYLVPHTIRMLADLKGLAVAELCDALVRNSEQVYGPW